MPWNSLHTAMSQDDTTNFWKSWRTIYNNNNSQFAPVVDGCSDKHAIAESFRKSFEANSEPNNRQRVDEINNEFSRCYKELSESHSSNCECNQYAITIELVIEAICSSKSGKCADESSLQAEHFHFAPINFLKRLTTLFSTMLNHKFMSNLAATKNAKFYNWYVTRAMIGRVLGQVQRIVTRFASV